MTPQISPNTDNCKKRTLLFRVFHSETVSTIVLLVYEKCENSIKYILGAHKYLATTDLNISV